MDPTTKIKELEARRAARLATLADQKTEQRATDLEAIESLQIEHGDENITTLTVNAYRPGLPVVVAVRAPTEPEYRRYVQMVRRAGQDAEKRGKAGDMLAEACWAYPSEAEDRKAMAAAFPGLIVSVSLEAARLAELKGAEEGKD